VRFERRLGLRLLRSSIIGDLVGDGSRGRGEGRMITWRGAQALGLLSCVLVLGCALDERKLGALGSDGGVRGRGGSEPIPDGPTGANAGRPVREVDTTPVDLGPIAIGFPSRARVVIQSVGDAALPPPDVRLSETSDPDFGIVQNQCQGEVPPGRSCDVRVQLVPSKAGPIAATLRVAGAGSGAVDVPLSGVGLIASQVTLTPAAGSFEDFGDVLVGATAEGVFSVQNPGTEPTGALRVTVNQPAFAILPSASAERPDLAPCSVGEPVPAGVSCAVRVGFTPSARGPVEATLTAVLGETSGVSTTLSGAGMVTGVLTVSPTMLDFEGVLPGETARRSLTIENAGDEPLTLDDLSVQPADGSAFSIVGGTCAVGLSIAGGASCGLQLVFRPDASDVASSAEVVIGATGGQEQRVTLGGRALKPGELQLMAATAGEDDFGDVLVGDGLVHIFRVHNPGAQPSGVLTLQVSDGFEIEPSAAEGGCTADTSLVDAQSCAVHVRFAPTERGPAHGALTVSSELVGATSLALSGNGVAPAALLVSSVEMDFGRVATGTTARNALTLSNTGDQVMPAPTIEVRGAAPAQAAAFSFESGCSAQLGFEESCEVQLEFAPSAAVAHSATLEMVAEPGGHISVLLLGQAIVPGSLTLAPVANGGADFGDVALGSSVMRSFTLKNPGGEPSGPVTLRTDDPAFAVSPRACGELEPSGLVDDASCTFDVTFNPRNATAAVARLLATSSALGEVRLELRGRGRAPARLEATTKHDFGMLRVGAEPAAANQLTWAVNNGGDLATGDLEVVAGNPYEFRAGEDDCTHAAIPGRGRCQMQLAFWPSEPGQRSGSITVTDTGSGDTLTLALTGVGLAGLGDACGDGVDCDSVLACTACSDGSHRCTEEGGCCDACQGEQVCLANGRCGCPGTEIDCGDGVCVPDDATDELCCAASDTCPVCQECEAGRCGLVPAQTTCSSEVETARVCTADGACVPACTIDVGCGTPCTTCVDGGCIALPAATTCFSSSIISGYCSGEAGACVQCLEDAHCPSMVCNEATHQCACSATDGCGSGVCVDGFCVLPEPTTP
jgi:hypothetical protein